MQPKILVVDDEEHVLSFFKSALKSYDITLARNGAQAIQQIEQGKQFDVIVSDLKMPRIDGLELLEFVKDQQIPSEVVIITGYGTIGSAVKAMKLGALDFIAKPLEVEETLSVVKKAVETARSKKAPLLLREEARSARSFGSLIGQSSAMERTYHLLEKAAQASELTLLIHGETGTGKELAAKSIHEQSVRRNAPFIVANCDTLSPETIETTLYGAADQRSNPQKGLLEQAGQGTLFLDEVGALPLEAQLTLKRALDSSEAKIVGGERSFEIKCRIIAATNQDPLEAIRKGRFRKDLYYRLNAFTITMPPLRERLGDIPLLAYRFLESVKATSNAKSISSEALALLIGYDWPGNVRELKNYIAFAAGTTASAEIKESDLPISHENKLKPAFITEEPPNLTYRQAIEDGRKRIATSYLSSLIKSTSGNVSKAAKIADIERGSLHRILKQHNINPQLDRLSRKD